MPKKEVPFAASTFNDRLESYSFQKIKSSISVGYNIIDITIGLGGSLTEFYDFKMMWRDQGEILRDNCTMIGGVFTIGYRFKRFYFKGNYLST